MKRRQLPFVLALFLSSCTHAAAPATAPVAARAPAPVAPVVPAVVTPAAPDPHAGVVDQLVGVWVGEADTPVGEMPFGIQFVREPDGSVHGRAEQGPNNYLDFRFQRAGARWLLREEGALPELGVQTHVLTPVAADVAGARWVTEDPSYLVVTIGVDGDALSFVATIRGEDHAAFRLRRIAGQGVSSR